MDRVSQKVKLFAVTAPSKGGPLHKGFKPKAEVQFFGKLDYVVQKSKPKYSTTTVQCPPPLGANTLRRGNREGFKIWSPWGTRIEPLPVLRFLIHFSSRTVRDGNLNRFRYTFEAPEVVPPWYPEHGPQL